jgi:hypothetical protein
LTSVRHAEADALDPLSSPACSLDRLLLRYGSRRIMISPADKIGFLAELQLRCPRVRQIGS